MSEAPAPIDTDAWSHRERCLYWARVFAMPHREFRTRPDGKIVSFLETAGGPALLASEALRHYAEHEPK